MLEIVELERVRCVEIWLAVREIGALSRAQRIQRARCGMLLDRVDSDRTAAKFEIG